MKFLTGLLAGLFLRSIARLLITVVALGAIVLALTGAFEKDGTLGRAFNDATGGGTTTSARVIRAVDGDTLLVRTAGQRERVRILGIDTPETVKPGAPVQRCGPAASARAKAWVRSHPRVRLVTDPSAPDRDQYGRLLRYVEPRGGGRDLSTVQVAAGLAKVKAYGQDLDRLDDLRSAQRRARRADRGLWGSGCS